MRQLCTILIMSLALVGEFRPERLRCLVAPRQVSVAAKPATSPSGRAAALADLLPLAEAKAPVDTTALRQALQAFLVIEGQDELTQLANTPDEQLPAFAQEVLRQHVDMIP